MIDFSFKLLETERKMTKTTTCDTDLIVNFKSGQGNKRIINARLLRPFTIKIGIFGMLLFHNDLYYKFVFLKLNPIFEYVDHLQSLCTISPCDDDSCVYK